MRRVCRLAGLGVLAALTGCGPPRAAPRHVSAEIRKPQPPPAGAPHLTAGRFEIVVGPRDFAGAFLLDTLTGRVWRLVQKRGVRGEPYVWEHMDRLDSDADDYVFDQEHRPAATP